MNIQELEKLFLQKEQELYQLQKEISDAKSAVASRLLQSDPEYQKWLDSQIAESVGLDNYGQMIAKAKASTPKAPVVRGPTKEEIEAEERRRIFQMTGFH